MTFNTCIRLIQEKYQCTEKDAIEVLGLYKYKQAIKNMNTLKGKGKDKCMIEEKI